MNKTVGIVVAIAAVAALSSMLTVHLANALIAVTGPGSFGGAAQANGFGCAGGPGGTGGGGGTGNGGTGNGGTGGGAGIGTGGPGGTGNGGPGFGGSAAAGNGGANSC